MRTLVFATHNRGKLAELVELAAPLGLEVLPASAFPGLEPPEEDEATFSGNAAKKARHTARFTGLPALADDSGLEVDVLGGAPGVRSARFAGPGARDVDNNRKLLSLLATVPATERGARFRCAVALADPAGPLGAAVHVTTGTCAGEILTAPRGEGGFGYDPLFFVPSEGLTFAELPSAAKHRLSHRGQAMRAMLTFLSSYAIE